MYRRAAFALLPLLAACGGGGSTSGAIPQQAASVPLGTLSDVQRTIEPAQAALQAQYVSSSADLLYVGNTGNNSITVYRHDVSGNVAPKYTIAGPQTGLDQPGQLSQDAAGNLYVANGSYQSLSAQPAILVFAHGANGNVAPIRKLRGPSTGIHNVAAMTVDQATGKIFVDDFRFGADGYNVDVAMLRFPPNATGNTSPFARSAPGLWPAFQLASDSTGRNIIEAHSTNEPSNFGLGIDTLEKQFGNSADPRQASAITAFAASGIADDPTTKTYLTTAGGIYRLAETTRGNGTVEGNPLMLTPALVSIITSDTCGSQLALGYLRNIYVSHSKRANCPNDAVVVYAHDASGNVPPLRTISGPSTGLNQPYGIYEGK